MNDKFSKIIIFSDFDGTFYHGPIGAPPQKNLDAVEYFKANGGHFSLSTGRLPSILKKIYPNYVNVVNAPCIMGNGSLLYDSSTEEFLEKRYFDIKKVLKINKDVREKFSGAKLRHAIYKPDGMIVEEPTESDYNVPSVFKMWYIAEDEKTATDIRDYVLEKYSGEANVFRSWFEMTEICDIAASKAIMVDRVKDYVSKKTGINKNEIITCSAGDFENDISILKATDYAFCPSNAIDGVKAICNRVFCKCEDGAMAEMINYIEKELI